MMNASSPSTVGSQTLVGEDVHSAEINLNIVSAAIVLVICILGLLGNLAVLFVIIVLKEYKKSNAHWYMLQLAIADFLFLATLPFNASENLHDAWIYPEWMCKARETILFINYYASMLFLMIMSLDRYLAVCHAFSVRLQRLRKLKFSVVIAFVVWATCLAMTSPMMLYAFKAGVPPHCKCTYVFPGENHIGLLEEDYKVAMEISGSYGGETQCREFDLSLFNMTIIGNLTANSSTDQDYYDYYGDYGGASGDYSSDVEFESCNYKHKPMGWNALIIFNFTAMFVLPLTVMVICYTLVVKHMKNIQVQKTSTNQPFLSKKDDLNHNISTSVSSGTGRKKITIICGMLVGCFVVCWLPFHLIHMIKVIGTIPVNRYFCEALHIIGSGIAYLNSALNPWLYSFLRGNFSKRLRRAVNRILTRSDPSNRFLSVRFKRAKRCDSFSSSNVATIVTKVFKDTNQKAFLASEAEHIPLDLTNFGRSKFEK